MGGEFGFCPVGYDKNVDVGSVSLENLDICPMVVLLGILDDAYYT